MLKHRVTSDPVLWQPDHNRPFILEVDASQYTTSAILWQEDDKGKKRAIGYNSSTLSDAERNYPIYDRELLAMIRGLENWRYLLAGTKTPIRVLSDHKNLTFWKDGHNIGRQVAQWMGILADYNISIEHHPGTKNRADPLSRRPDHDDVSRDNLNVTVLPDQLFVQVTDIIDIETAVINAQRNNESTIKQWARTYPNITQ